MTKTTKRKKDVRVREGRVMLSFSAEELAEFEEWAIRARDPVATYMRKVLQEHAEEKRVARG